MLTRTEPEQIESYLDDSSHMRGGFAERVVFPESGEEVSQILVDASKTGTPITVSLAGDDTLNIKSTTIRSTYTLNGGGGSDTLNQYGNNRTFASTLFETFWNYGWL